MQLAGQNQWINHIIRVELVKTGPERYRNKYGLFQSMIRVIHVGDSERKAVSCLSAKWFYKTLKKGLDQCFSKFFSHFFLTNTNIVNSFTNVTKNICKNFTLPGYGSRYLLKSYLWVKLKDCKRTVSQKSNLKKLQKKQNHYTKRIYKQISCVE